MRDPLVGAPYRHGVDGALYFIASQSTTKGRNLASEPRCVITTSSTTLPSIDIVVEGLAERVTHASDLRHAVDMFIANEWPAVGIQGDSVYGPNAPSAGPPPNGMFRLVPSVVFGLPGMYGMEQFKPEELPKPTRWEFN